MRFWTWCLLLLLVAAATAFGWQWIAEDPGYVLVRMRGWSLETSVVVAIIALLVAWGLFGAIWRLARWPMRAWGRSQRRRGRERLAGGLAAFAEGRYAQAERDLGKAAQQPALRGPALLAMARAAHARGEDARASQILDDAAVEAPQAALAQRAKFLLERDRSAEALALLRAPAHAGTLPPVGWRAFIEAALAQGEADAALDALPRLSRTQSLAPDAMAAIETRVLVAALDGAPSQARLNTSWNATSRARRQQPVIVAAFARRAAGFGQVLAAMDEIETAQRREWSETLATAYGELGPAEAATRLRHAEAWLAVAPNSPALLTTLGRLCVEQGLWGKAIQYLERAIAIDGRADAWESLGDAHAGAGERDAAIVAYANAARAGRGAATTPLASRHAGPVDTRALVVEERDAHGVPRLPRGG